MILEAA